MKTILSEVGEIKRKTNEKRSTAIIKEKEDLVKSIEKRAGELPTLNVKKNNYLERKIKTMNNGKQLLEIGDSVTFVLLTEDDKVIFGKQYRPCIDGEIYNTLGGMVDKGETIEQAIIRECKEESNVDVDEDDIFFLYENKFVSAGYTNERNSLAVISLDQEISELDLKCNDKNENIKLITMDLEDFVDLKLDCLKLHLLQEELEEASDVRIMEEGWEEEEKIKEIHNNEIENEIWEGGELESSLKDMCNGKIK